ncbi:MAG: hypothetical protein OHK0045_02450 [Raineya sp.]
MPFSAVVTIVALSIPIVSIVGYYYTRLKELEQNKTKISEKDIEMLQKIKMENEQLRQRVENLEQIITSLDKDLLTLRSPSNPHSLQQQVEEILKKLKS